MREAVPGIDHVFGVGQWAQAAKALSVEPAELHDIPESAVHVRGASAYLKISDGCDAPLHLLRHPQDQGRAALRPRGLPRSVRAQRLVGAGARELVLVAQDSTAWGEDLGIRDGLPGLLGMLAEAVGPDVWLRLMYAYPSRVRPRLIEAMASIPNVLPYLDVPLQHGSERVLRRMRRPHKVEKTLAMVDALA